MTLQARIYLQMFADLKQGVAIWLRQATYRPGDDDIKRCPCRSAALFFDPPSALTRYRPPFYRPPVTDPQLPPGPCRHHQGRYLPARIASSPMATKPSSDASTAPSPTSEAEPIFTEASPSTMPDWLARAVEQGVKPEQALAFIGLGLMGKLAEGRGERPWVWSEEEDAGGVDLAALRQRLELVQLALQTGAPLSTAELTQLLGARPGAATVQRGGLTARRLGRNVWKLSRSSEEADRPGASFSDGFRRRF